MPRLAKRIASIALLSLVTLCAEASMRCDNGIASEGDAMAQVIQKCGSPASREQIATGEDRRDIDRRKYTTIEQWVYGPRSGMYQYLRFEGGKLVQIKGER
ncbi:DUF2845 domain-containing protein [Pseudomonas sp. RC10]|uniref:DUF2845 domain-containing protein n=1 Tax=Pseudomonas bambusae TaxID=3139142 RepID=UPI00313A4D5E